MTHIFHHEKTNVLHRYSMKQTDGSNSTDFFLLSDVAKLLRVHGYQIVYQMVQNPTLEPRLRIGGRRIFTIEDIHRIAEKLQIQLAGELAAKGEL